MNNQIYRQVYNYIISIQSTKEKEFVEKKGELVRVPSSPDDIYSVQRDKNTGLGARCPFLEMVE